jgi:hypothetical protein
MIQDRIEDVKNAGKFRGRKEYLAYLQGKLISRTQAMYAQCFDCMGYYSDGAQDCEVPECPMYGYMPYRVKKVKKPRSPAQHRADVSRTEKMKKKRSLDSGTIPARGK